jgi:hypothetical protein
MSAPDSSNSKAPPSLLADPAKGPQAAASKGTASNSSRILADLEGRVAPPTDQPRRSKAPAAVLVALLVVAVGGWGAWHLQQRGAASHAEVAATPAVTQTAAASAAAVGGSAAQVAARSASSVVAAASAPQAATIIADDGESKDSRSSADVNAALANGADDNNRISRALANGADMGNASAATVEPSKHVKPAVSASAATGRAHHEHEASTAHAKHDTREAHETHEAPANHHANQTALAQAKKDKPHAASSATASKDDPDADLLAALVARTKPADTKSASSGTTKVSASAGDPKLAERVKECGTRGFFEDQLCRWRVCDGHWGKDPSCPGAAQKQPQP